jgi:hypothetical protein
MGSQRNSKSLVRQNSKAFVRHNSRVSAKKSSKFISPETRKNLGQAKRYCEDSRKAEGRTDLGIPMVIQNTRESKYQNGKDDFVEAYS